VSHSFDNKQVFMCTIPLRNAVSDWLISIESCLLLATFVNLSVYRIASEKPFESYVIVCSICVDYMIHLIDAVIHLIDAVIRLMDAVIPSGNYLIVNP